VKKGGIKAFLSGLLAFFLAGSLILFCLAFACGRAAGPVLYGEENQPGSADLEEERRLIGDKVAGLSEILGFSADPVMELVTPENLGDLHALSAEWWRDLLHNGYAGADPRWDSPDLLSVLRADPAFSGMDDPDLAEERINTAAEEIRKAVIRVVFPFRPQLLRFAVEKLSRRVDIPNLMDFLRGTPWAFLALCALLSGLIVLAGGAGVRPALRYIGAALGAAALTVAACAVLYLCAGVLPMVREASESLTAMYRSASSRALVPAALFAGILAAGCALCLSGGKRVTGRS